MTPRALVTGGAGFIGSHLVHRLLERGDRVRVLDDFSTGRRENLAAFDGDLELVEGDLRDFDAVRAAVRAADVVFHQGALPSVPRSIHDPLTTNAVNVGGTLNVLLAAREHGVGRIVFASSSSVYGNDGPLPRVESLPARPVSPYAVSKLAAEAYCSALGGDGAVSLRYFNVFGPRQDPTSEYASVVPRFIAAVAAGQPVRIYGDGEQTRDFTYVSDVVDAAILAADHDGPPPGTINVAGGRPTSVNALADAIGATLGLEVRKEYLAARPYEVRDSGADVSKARHVLGFAPRVSLAGGLAMTASALTGPPLAVGESR